jgi:hypothetical protein
LKLDLKAWWVVDQFNMCPMQTGDGGDEAETEPVAWRHPGVLRFWMAPMRSPERYRAEVSGQFRRARKLQIRSDLGRILGARPKNR